MKKLLSLLTLTTLAMSVPAPLLANTPLTRDKRDVGTSEKDITDGLQINIKDSDKLWIKISNPLTEINPDEKYWYFIIVKGINIDWGKNIYDSSELKWDFTNQRLDFPKLKPIGEGTIGISLEKNRTPYFIYKWSSNWGDSYIPKQPIIDKNANIIDWNIDVSPFQKGITFSIDNDNNGYWLKPYQLVTKGQVKVKIANTNIKIVKVNGKEMPQTNKVWEFDLPTDSTTVENKDYKIEIAFTLDKKSYVGQILVSLLLSQPSINVKKNTSVIGNVDSYVYQAPTNGKVGDITLTSDLYYSDTKVKVSLSKPTGSTTITAQIFGLDEKWEKNKKVFQIFDNQTHNLDGSQLETYQGHYLIETEDNAKNKSSYHVIINKNNSTLNFWDTEQGKTFYQWANSNGYNKNIKKLNATELNKIIKDSTNWQKLASDSQFSNAVAEWFKTNGKLASKESLIAEQVIEQLKTEIPSSIIIHGVNTSNYDVNKVRFEVNKSESKPNDKVNIVIKYGSEKSNSFTLQIQSKNPPDSNKKGLTGWAIIGIVVGSLLGLLILGWLFKKFVVRLHPKK
ncbi:hypothetical protein [Spiroplasma endosymbiont of Polydrusus cervinus]|uniref:hypothetical protein n=1 Tax=Spiroplasma endosymbiont of Polydrusus cervinus TaxID=3066287 RepID=UPI0030D28894